MSFRTQIQKYNQLIRDTQKLEDDYKGKKKGQAYQHILSYLISKAKTVSYSITHYGQAEIYRWYGIIEIEIEGILVIKKFEVLLVDSNNSDVQAFIEYKLNGKVMLINKRAIKLGLIKS